jgi:hypothetical protein
MSSSTSEADSVLKDLYVEMYKLTEPLCAGTSSVGSCNLPRSCCSPEYCDLAQEWALERWGVQLQVVNKGPIKFMGRNGCTVAPHLRPLCTIHTCKIQAWSSSGDRDWDKKYFDLREQIDHLEAER